MGGLTGVKASPPPAHLICHWLMYLPLSVAAWPRPTKCYHPGAEDAKPAFWLGEPTGGDEFHSRCVSAQLFNFPSASPSGLPEVDGLRSPPKISSIPLAGLPRPCRRPLPPLSKFDNHLAPQAAKSQPPSATTSPSPAFPPVTSAPTPTEIITPP